MDLMFKAATQAAWNAYISAAPWPWNTHPDRLIDEIGPIMVTPPVLDEDGNIITPAVMDNAHHVNVRVLTPINSQTDESGTITFDVCAQMSLGGEGVDWIDPATVNSPSRIWAGGMNYWTPQA